MLAFTVIVSSIVQAVVSFYIFRKGRHNVSYLLFFGLSIITWCWAFLNYLSVIWSHSVYLTLIVRLIMFFAVIQVYLFYLFANAFPYVYSLTSRISISNHGWLTLLTSAVTLSPYMFRSAAAVNGIANVQVGPGIAIFIVYIAFYIVNAFIIMTRKFQEAVGIKRVQLLILLAAAVLNWAIIPLTNFVFTLTFKTMLFATIAPVYSLIFASVIGYALIKHRLFDARTDLRNSTIYVNNYLKNPHHRAIEYYELQSLVYESDSSHVSLDFSGVKDLDRDAVTLLKNLRNYMKKQGKKIYFVSYTQKVFEQLRPADK